MHTHTLTYKLKLKYIIIGIEGSIKCKHTNYLMMIMTILRYVPLSFMFTNSGITLRSAVHHYLKTHRTKKHMFTRMYI